MSSGVFTHEIPWPAGWIPPRSIKELAFVTEHCLNFFIHHTSDLLKLVWIAAPPTESSAYFVGLEPNFDEVWVMEGVTGIRKESVQRDSAADSVVPVVVALSLERIVA